MAKEMTLNIGSFEVLHSNEMFAVDGGISAFAEATINISCSVICGVIAGGIGALIGGAVGFGVGAVLGAVGGYYLGLYFVSLCD